jgi:aldose 1-epimerase
MRPTIKLVAGFLAAEIVPSLGGGVARFDFLHDGQRMELFRAWPEEGTNDPNELGLYVLIPWSNRISGQGFSFEGRFQPLASNFGGESCPIHGNGWLSPWLISFRDGRRVNLKLSSDGPGPYRYEATLEYRLDTDGMMIRLAATNAATTSLPFGLGFHPWLPRTPGTLLMAEAQKIWLEDSCHLPTEQIAVSSRPEWDFSSLRALPPDWVNSGFVGWNRQASIFWEDRRLALEVEASPLLSCYILYSPSAEAEFFCFEPVSHPVNAHHLPPGPEAHGLVILAPGETLTAECRFRLREIPSRRHQ